ncbi:hypothetical protein [Streptomyces phaeochromogenes]|nr:hypothetical protein OG478_27630 [Streptomyces phaeochromogenes]WSW21833.1 hypothetical protein OG277_23990 [Streptomyces phaeochromogenes]
MPASPLAVPATGSATACFVVLGLVAELPFLSRHEVSMGHR